MTHNQPQSEYNLRSPAVKRLMREAEELREPTEEYYAQPLDDNLFEWHFTVRGPPDSDFQSGYYHGRIILPSEYPMKPPSIILLTPSGRFEVNKKICLSISGHHPESWQPSWSIRTALLAIIGFMPTQGRGALGSLDYEPEERRSLALLSQSWSCPTCGPIHALLTTRDSNSSPRPTSQQQQELVDQISFHSEAETGPRSGTTTPAPAPESQPSDGLRNRTSPNPTGGMASPVVASPDPQTSSTHQRNSQTMVSNESSGQFTLYLMLIMGAAFVLLLIRRLFL